MAAETGMVKIHAQTMRSTTLHLMALNRFAQPTPMMEAEILCVVETGMPSHVARAMTVAELVSAAKPLMGCSFTILWPSVLMMRQPPTAVPDAIVNAQDTLIHTAISIGLGAGSGVTRKEKMAGKWSNVPALVPPSSTRAMMPIVFWASLVP